MSGIVKDTPKAEVLQEKKEGKKPLIEEINAPSAAPPPPKGILKNASTNTPPATAESGQGNGIPLDISWNWEKEENGKLKVTIWVPDLVCGLFLQGYDQRA